MLDHYLNPDNWDITMTAANQRTMEWWLREGQFDHRAVVGGKWDTVGQLQLDFLVERGLTPASSLLEIGCGSLRAGRHFLPYLEPGHYVGLDPDPGLINQGVAGELGYEKVLGRSATFVIAWIESAPLERFAPFDFMIANSIFTHMDPPAILEGLCRCAKALRPGGKIYATFNMGDAIICGKPYPVMTWYPLEMFEWMARHAELGMTYIGDWGHPRNINGKQLMLEFSK